MAASISWRSSLVKFGPGFVAFCFVDRQQNVIGVYTRLRHLCGLQVVFRVVDRGLIHRFHLFEREAVGRRHIDRVLFAGARVARGHVQDSVGVDQEAYFDPRHAGGHGRDVFQIEAREAAAVLREFALTLHHVDEDIASVRRRLW